VPVIVIVLEGVTVADGVGDADSVVVGVSVWIDDADR
jgi:hypothetical protein